METRPHDASLDGPALRRLVERVFRPRAGEDGLALLVDVPDAEVADTAAWADRRALALEWFEALNDGAAGSVPSRVSLWWYRNARRNNADLPAEAVRHVAGEGAAVSYEALGGERRAMDAVFDDHPWLIAINRFSATAPLKLAARRHGFRAASMPGFGRAMVPALALDWVEIDARCRALAAALDRAHEARIVTRAAARTYELRVDLRHRRATPSGGLLAEPGTAGNLPSGETYIVPYEGEVDGDPSRTAGSLPLELDGELLVYRIERNRIVVVEGDGPVATRERDEVAREPGYRNVAELGLGVLGAQGIEPVGEILLDEKLGLHVAFGRSDHFPGGTVGAAAFSSPERVVHIDRVYIPAVQPGVAVERVSLHGAGDASGTTLIRDGAFVDGDPDQSDGSNDPRRRSM